MERIPEQNFHEISEDRKELRKAIKELDASLAGKKPSLKDKNERMGLSADLDNASDIAKGFKVPDLGNNWGGIKVAVEALKKQKNKAEGELLPVDLEAIYEQFPEFRKIEETESYIQYLKDKRMKETFALKGSKKEGDEKKFSRHLAKTEELIADIKTDLEKFPALDLRAGELVSYKQNLSESGHICMTPSTEKNLEAIGDKMLSGKPVFLHGPTGTGKTTLAEYAAKHFTGKDAEMVYCSPQTKESNTWGRTGVQSDGGVPVTVFIEGPLARALKEGKVIIFDEFTDLPKEQVSFLKAVFSKKVGDTISIQGNGDVVIAQGFQMIFTSNLKSKKNLEKSELPPQMADEFTQNNIEINYTPKGEAYDIMLARLLNRDGTLDMSYYDLNTTLKSLCEAMEEIQKSYVGETDPERAKKLGEVSANNKFHSFEKFVMTQRSVEAILSLWDIEKLKKDKKTFAEFIDDRLLTALNFKEFSEKDRVLAAKIFASRGFLTTAKKEDLGVLDSEGVLKLNTKRAEGVENATKNLQKESGAVKHLDLKDVAMLDPFGKRAEMLKNQAEALLGDENTEKGDDFSRNLKKKMGKLFGKEKKNQASEITAEYEHPDGHKETITLDFETKLQDFISFYQKTNIDLPADFEDTIQDIFSNNEEKITEAIEQNGFDELLIIPGNIPLADLVEKMKMESGYFEYSNFTDGGGFAGAKSQNVDKPRIILVHKTKELTERPELNSTLNTKGQDVKMDEALSLEDYIVFQKKYFEETGKHLDETKYTWLATKSGARLVCSHWHPGDHKLPVDANDLELRHGILGVRPSRCFF